MLEQSRIFATQNTHSLCQMPGRFTYVVNEAQEDAMEFSVIGSLQRPTERGTLLRRLEVGNRGALLPKQLDFGLVQAGTAPTKRGGVTSPPADARRCLLNTCESGNRGGFLPPWMIVYSVAATSEKLDECLDGLAQAIALCGPAIGRYSGR